MSFSSSISLILFSLWMYLHLWLNFLFFFVIYNQCKAGQLRYFNLCLLKVGFSFILVLLNSLHVIWLLCILFGNILFVVPGFMWRFLFVCEKMSLCKEYQFYPFNSNLIVLYFCVLPDYLDKNVRILRSVRMKVDSLALFHRCFFLFSKMLMFVDL